MNRNEIINQIQQLLEKHKCGVDGFFFDEKGAAIDIFSFLEDKLAAPVIAMEKAA